MVSVAGLALSKFRGIPSQDADHRYGHLCRRRPDEDTHGQEHVRLGDRRRGSQRKELLRREAAVWKQREKLGAIDREAERAEAALKEVRRLSISKIGDRGVPGSGAWGRQLRAGEIAHFRAQDVKQAAGANSWELDGEETEPWGVKGQIERQSTEIADALFQNLRAIEDAVAATLVPEFKKLDARINELENEKAALEQTPLAWRDFFGVEANHGRGGGRGDFATVGSSACRSARGSPSGSVGLSISIT